MYAILPNELLHYYISCPLMWILMLWTQIIEDISVYFEHFVLTVLCLFFICCFPLSLFATPDVTTNIKTHQTSNIKIITINIKNNNIKTRSNKFDIILIHLERMPIINLRTFFLNSLQQPRNNNISRISNIFYSLI